MRLLRVLTLGVAACAACVSPVVLEDAVLAYDKSLSRVRSQVLLLNIARARAGLPLNATEVTALTATFEFEAQADVGAGAAPIGGAGGPTGELSLGLSTRALESPTLSIVPLQGEEFTRRLLAPIDARTFEFVHHRRVGVGLLLRLLAQSIVLEEGGRRVTFDNDPDQPDEFAEFRRRVLHLDSLALRGALDVGPIPRLEVWRPTPEVELDGLTAALDHGFRLERDAQGPLLVRKVEGRVLVANYDPEGLSDEERFALDARAREYPDGFLLVDVREGGPGGDYALRGWIKLRSFQQVLDFVARGIDPDWERPVPAHPATAPVPAQPARTFVVEEGASAPDDATVAVELNGRSFWIPAAPGASAADDWNLRAFQVLMHLYHLTTRNPGTALPTVVSVGGR